MSQPFVVPPPTGDAAARPVLAGILHERLHGSSEPVLMSGVTTIPGASVWTAARGLVRQLREAGLGPAERVLLCTDDGILVAVALVAAVTGRFSLAVMPSGAEEIDTARTLEAARAADARLVLVGRSDAALAAGSAAHMTSVGLDGLDRPEDLVLRHPGRATDGESALLLLDPGSPAPGWTASGFGPLAEAVRARLDERHGPSALADGRRPAGVQHLTVDVTTTAGVVDLLAGLLAAEVLLLDAAPAVADVTDRTVGALGGPR